MSSHTTNRTANQAGNDSGNSRGKEIAMSDSIGFNEACEHLAANYEATNGFVSKSTYRVALEGGVKEITFEVRPSGIVRPVADS